MNRTPVRRIFSVFRGGLCRANLTDSRYADANFNIQFDHVRGQPENIRFALSNKKWTDWKRFSESMSVPLSKRPLKYQLKSRLGVISKVNEMTEHFSGESVKGSKQGMKDTIPDQSYVVLQRGDVTAVVVNNDAVNDKVLRFALGIQTADTSLA